MGDARWRDDEGYLDADALEAYAREYGDLPPEVNADGLRGVDRVRALGALLRARHVDQGER